MNLADGLIQLTRMCARYKCANCPMCDIGFCSLGQKDRSANANVKAAAIIEKWAEENPEPKYPTWGEWLIEQGVYTGTFIVDEPKSGDTIVDIRITDKIYQQIPDDIAQKLGLEPKEG